MALNYLDNLSIPIFLKAAFVFSSLPEQIKDQISNRLSEASAYGTIRKIDSDNHRAVIPLVYCALI